MSNKPKATLDPIAAIKAKIAEHETSVAALQEQIVRSRNHLSQLEVKFVGAEASLKSFRDLLGSLEPEVPPNAT